MIFLNAFNKRFRHPGIPVLIFDFEFREACVKTINENIIEVTKRNIYIRTNVLFCQFMLISALENFHTFFCVNGLLLIVVSSGFTSKLLNIPNTKRYQ